MEKFKIGDRVKINTVCKCEWCAGFHGKESVVTEVLDNLFSTVWVKTENDETFCASADRFTKLSTPPVFKTGDRVKVIADGGFLRLKGKKGRIAEKGPLDPPVYRIRLDTVNFPVWVKPRDLIKLKPKKSLPPCRFCGGNAEVDRLTTCWKDEVEYVYRVARCGGCGDLIFSNLCYELHSENRESVKKALNHVDAELKKLWIKKHSLNNPFITG